MKQVKYLTIYLLLRNKLVNVRHTFCISLCKYNNIDQTCIRNLYIVDLGLLANRNISMMRELLVFNETYIFRICASTNGSFPCVVINIYFLLTSTHI
jgi:hypothetical protein